MKSRTIRVQRYPSAHLLLCESRHEHHHDPTRRTANGRNESINMNTSIDEPRRNAFDRRLHPPAMRRRRRLGTPRWVRSGVAALALGSALLSACASAGAAQSPPTLVATTPAGSTTPSASTTSGPTTPGSTTGEDHHDHDATISRADRAAAQLATAGYQDVKTAEAHGWASSLDNLGCFQDAALGGMGVHYINQALMDGKVDITKPEALVYELDANGKIAGLVAHEYIVPIEAWTSPTPPSLFGVSFHRHPTLPLWVLHAWLWKDNPTGIFQDWNPAVRQCPSNVPIFGVDRPLPPGSSTTTTPTTPTSPYG